MYVLGLPFSGIFSHAYLGLVFPRFSHALRDFISRRGYTYISIDIYVCLGPLGLMFLGVVFLASCSFHHALDLSERLDA
jgi:hypothetical protein